MTYTTGAQRASGPAYGTTIRRAWAGLLIASLCALVVQLAPGSPATRTARADTAAVPKAVFIVGPTNGLTDSNLADAEKMATQAEAAGMEVHRVFFPHATWDNVLANIQDANLVVYMGHGYGWPSPYTKVLTEARQDGMGLNSFDGSAKNEYTYYGATRLRESIHLAPNAIVFLNHLCYSAGNAEPGMAIPAVDLAAERVDNMASGWLAIGARTVFAYGWWQRMNYPQALMSTNSTMDDLFTTVPSGSAAGSPAGYVGWQDARLDSVRTPGATIHLDPHKKYGYYRALTGDPAMTAAEFRASAVGTAGSPSTGGDPSAPPEITSLSAAPDGDPAGGTALAGGEPVSFHPNGDGIDDDLVVTHVVTKATNLDVTVTNANEQVVATYSVWSARGTSTSHWDGRDSSGAYVADGTYTLVYVPRDSGGLTGTPVSTQTLVLTAAKLAKPSKVALYAADADRLAKRVRLGLTINQPAHLTWQIFDAGGKAVRTVNSDSSVSAGTRKFMWDGRSDSNAFVPDGWYRSVVTARTSLGTYSQERQVYVGAFRVVPSLAEPVRGSKLTLTLISTEPLKGAPTVHVTQPGTAAQDLQTTRLSKTKFKVTFTVADGVGGSLDLVVSGTDKYGGHQQTQVSLPLS